MSTPNETQDPSIDQGLLSSAQVPTSPNHGSDYATVIPASVQLTDEIYWNAQPLAVRVLRQNSGPAQQPGTSTTWKAIPPGDALWNAAMQLAANGYKIDTYIMALANDPVVTMLLRTEDGDPYVFPLLSATVFTPTPGQPEPASGALPPGVIKTSLDPADYPPFYPPTPPAPPPTSLPAGIIGNFQGLIPAGVFSYMPNGGQLFAGGALALQAVASGQIVNGETVVEGGKSYKVALSVNIFGETVTFYIPF